MFGGFKHITQNCGPQKSHQELSPTNTQKHPTYSMEWGNHGRPQAQAEAEERKPQADVAF